MKNASDRQVSVRWVVMGVSGCGKSTVGRELAAAHGCDYVEGDAFHRPASVAKMAAGVPLLDDDRAGWLGALQHQIGCERERGISLVLACSALKRAYRDLLREADPALRFAHLDGPRELVAARLMARTGHFMPALLLDSQLALLEPLGADEPGLVLDLRQTPAGLVAQILLSEPGPA